MHKKGEIALEHYIGIKEVDAKPMTRGEYNKYRGWTIPADENPDDEGYLVKHFDDYESWTPKEAFEKAYVIYYGTGLLSTVEDMKSLDYKKRFKAEFNQLTTRLIGLKYMLKKYQAGTLDFKPSCSYNLLHQQYVHMYNYMRCLTMRAYIENIYVDVPQELDTEDF